MRRAAHQAWTDQPGPKSPALKAIPGHCARIPALPHCSALQRSRHRGRHRSCRSGRRGRPAPRIGRYLPWPPKLPAPRTPSCSCCPELPARPPPPDIPRLSCPAQPALLPGDAGGASPGLCLSIPAPAPPAAGPWRAAAAPTAEQLIRGLGGMVQPWAAHLQPTRRRAPGKAAGLPGFDAGRQIGGAAPHGPPQAPDPPVCHPHSER